MAKVRNFEVTSNKFKRVVSGSHQTRCLKLLFEIYHMLATTNMAKVRNFEVNSSKFIQSRKL